MKILILGGAGFIGSHIVRRVLREWPDALVDVIDNLWTGLESNLPDDSRILLNVANVEAPCRISPIYDHVYHLASPASPVWYSPEPIRTIMANVAGAELATRAVAPGGKIFFTSTSEVYGDPRVSPQPEDYLGMVKSCGPRGAYDEGKRCAEALLWNNHRLRGDYQLKIARIFNCYGPHTRPDDGRAVSNFLTAGMRGEALRVFGTGDQTRCFGHVDDIVQGLWCLFHETPPDFVGPLNIGLDVEISVNQLANFIAYDLFGGSVGVVHVDPTPDDPQQRRPDLTLCRKIIPQWNPTIHWMKGVEDTLKWFLEGNNK
jgi:nucleoside-diphosphate-sugar epimerase